MSVPPQNAAVPEIDAFRAALAPHGKLRLAFPVNNVLYATKDAANGAFKGVAIDVGAELSRRLGVPFEAAPYAAAAELMEDVDSDKWDVATIIIEQSRLRVVDYSQPFMETDASYLVPRHSDFDRLRRGSE